MAKGHYLKYKMINEQFNVSRFHAMIKRLNKQVLPKAEILIFNLTKNLRAPLNTTVLQSTMFYHTHDAQRV